MIAILLDRRPAMGPLRALAAFIFLFSFTTNAQAYFVGAGVSTLTEGRFVPSLNLGVPVGNGWLVSGMMGGVATDAYYCNGYMANVTRYGDFGKLGFGQLRGGFGWGAAFTQKGYAADPEDHPGKMDIDRDYSTGPAFRISFIPFKGMYVGFEMLMGIGVGILGNGWADTGIFALGGEF
jgi:hypothetical protein